MGRSNQDWGDKVRRVSIRVGLRSSLLLVEVLDESVGSLVEIFHRTQQPLVGAVAVGDDAFVGVEV